MLSNDQRNLVTRYRRLLATYEDNRDLVSVGAYREGADPELDEAIRRRAVMREFLMQDLDEQVTLAQAFNQLATVMK